MKISRELEVGQWDQPAVSVVLAYWKQRGFTNATVDSGMELRGTRGSWLGNLFSYDMSKVRASLKMSPIGQNRINVELHVRTFGQQITQWNRAYWRLEIVEVHHLLLGCGNIPEVWSRFLNDSRQASISWTFSLMKYGQQLTDEWEFAISNLEQC